MRNEFHSIDFGYADGRTEAARNPELLIHGFFDPKEITETVENGFHYLLLGYKGAGKSAVSERIRLKYENNFNYIITNIQLEEFSFTDFSKIIKGTSEPQSKYPDAWSWLLLIHAIHSLSKDYGVKSDRVMDFQDTLDALKAMGLLPDPNIKNIVRATSKNAFKLKLPPFIEATLDSVNPNAPVNIPVFNDCVKQLIGSLTTESYHFIIIDGLDDILTRREVQYDSLGALIFEVDRLNSQFRRQGLRLKIILLCRTDLFERLSGANKNKVRQDSALELDWFSDPNEPKNSMLVQAANTRAALSLKRQIDIFDEYFPQKIEGKETVTYLLDTTRHTPRDFFRALKFIQEATPKGSPLTVETVKSGLRNYSISYFLPEIRDEMKGYVKEGEDDKFIELLAALKKRELYFHELEAAAPDHGLSSDSALNISKILFECSAIGHVDRIGYDRGLFTFKYRNRNSTFDKGKRIFLHRGLWKALNI